MPFRKLSFFVMLVISVGLIALLSFFSNRSITGFVTYETSSNMWDFSNPSDYSYDSSALNLTSGVSLAVVSSVVYLDSLTTNRTFVASAYKTDGDDIDNVLGDVISKDNDWVTVGKDDILNLSFNHTITNITGYIDPDKAGTIKVCSSPSCSLVYSSFSHGTAKMWFSVSGIPSVSSVYLDGSQKVKYDYLEANFTDSRTYAVASNSYSQSGTVDTADFSPANMSKWGVFSSSEAVNGGTVSYSYSTDSGQSWSSVSSGDDLSLLDSSSGKLRFRAVLSGSGSVTPVVNGFGVGYSVISCAESWNAVYGSCLPDDSKQVSYVDSNSCGTSDGVPADNGTYLSCNYCNSTWSEGISSCGIGDSRSITYSYSNSCCSDTGLASDCNIPANRSESCDYCLPSWAESNGSCSYNDKLTSYFVDSNRCYSLTGLASDNNPPANRTYDCDYCTPSWHESESNCSVNDLRTISYAYSNSCCSDTGLASDCNIPVNLSESCDYCIPSWSEANGSCLANDSVISYFRDMNSCYSLTGISSDNDVPANKSYSCDFCSPDFSYFNTSCSKNNSLVMWANDSNSCYSKTGMSSDSLPENVSFSCDYCVPSWACIAYSGCNRANISSCLAVADSNGCYSITHLDSDLHSGNYSEFVKACVYDSEAPGLSEYKLQSRVVSPGENFTVLVNISDTSNVTGAYITVYNHNNKNISRVSGSFESSSYGLESNSYSLESSSYSFVVGTASLQEGIYSLDLAVVDANNNSGSYSLEPFVISNSSKSVIRSIVRKSREAEINDTENKVNLRLNLSEEVNGSVSMAAYSENIKNSTPSAREIGKYIEIVADESVKFRLVTATIRMDYNESDLAVNSIDESTLAIYFYNETSGIWEKLNSTLNASAHYVEAVIAHTSYFGVFGEQFAQQPNSVVAGSGGGSSGGGGGGGGGIGSGGFIKKTEAKKEVKADESAKAGIAASDAEQVPEPEELIEIPKCDYSLSGNLPEQVSLVINNTLVTTFSNSGSCAVDEMSALLGGELKQAVGISFEQVSPAVFSLNARPLEKPSQKGVGGFLVKAYEKKLKNYSGEIIVVGKVNGTAVAEESFPLSVTVEELERVNSPLSSFPLVLAGAGFAALVALALLGKKFLSKR